MYNYAQKCRERKGYAIRVKSHLVMISDRK